MEISKGSWVRHMNADWGKGVVIEVTDHSNLQVSFEKVGIRKVPIVHLSLIARHEASTPAGKQEPITADGRIYFSERFIDIYGELKNAYPNHIVIIQNGCYFEVLEDDAQYFGRLYGWKVYERQAGVSMTGFPVSAKKVWNDLKDSGHPYVVVSQLPAHGTGKVERTVSEIFGG